MRALRLARAAVIVLACGCVSQQQKSDAIADVNASFRPLYEKVLAESGTRRYKVSRDEAFAALRGAMTRLGFQVADVVPEVGYLSVYGPAPRPLTAAEWRAATERDLPLLREILRKHVGAFAELYSFEPEGLDVVINITVLETRDAREIALTMRLREVAPPQSGLPRREYPPPNAVRMGLLKIWAEVDREIGGRRVK